MNQATRMVRINRAHVKPCGEESGRDLRDIHYLAIRLYWTQLAKLQQADVMGTSLASAEGMGAQEAMMACDVVPCVSAVRRVKNRQGVGKPDVERVLTVDGMPKMLE